MRGGGQLSCSTLTLKSDEARELPLGESELNPAKSLEKSLSTRNRISTRILESFLKRNALGFCRRSSLTLECQETREISGVSRSTTLERKSENHLAQLITKHTKILESFSKKKLFRVLTHPNEICKTETANHSVIAGLTRNRRVAVGEGFTLAEVLITLGIIGIVAAMTMPNLIFDYKTKTTVSILKKNATILAQAFSLAVAENGDLPNWGTLARDKESIEIVVNKIKPYLKILDDCGTDVCNNYSDGITYLNNIKNETFNFTKDYHYKLRLADGTALVFAVVSSCSPNQRNCLDIYMDINGKQAPNTLGIDVFYFTIADNGKLTVGGIVGANPKDSGWESCNNHAQGWNCSAWVFYKENMDYLKCADKLEWDGKDRCNK